MTFKDWLRGGLPMRKDSKRVAPENVQPAENPPWIETREPNMDAGTEAYALLAFQPFTTPMAFWWPPPRRVPRLFYDGLRNTAGVHSIDAANVSAHGLFLPPLAPGFAAASEAAVGLSRWNPGGRIYAEIQYVPGAGVPISH